MTITVDTGSQTGSWSRKKMQWENHGYLRKSGRLVNSIVSMLISLFK